MDERAHMQYIDVASFYLLAVSNFVCTREDAAVTFLECAPNPYLHNVWLHLRECRLHEYMFLLEDFRRSCSRGLY